MTATVRPSAAPAAARNYPRIVTPVPGPNARRIVAQDEAFASPCYIKEYPLVIARGEKAMVEDVDGNRFLDFMAGIAVSSTGYGHPKVIAAIKAQADKFLHICGSDFYFEGLATMFERLAELAPGPSKKRVFLSNSGAEAVDGAIKLARNSTRRAGLIAFKGAFHGRTYGAMSLTSSKVKQHAGFGPLLSNVYHVQYANPYRCECGQAHADCHLHSIGAIEELFDRQVDPRDVAAIFVEPIQGEGGYIVPPPQFLPALRALCDKHGILLVCDEIQCGVGRTGKMWATEFAGIEPDILLTAKGLASGMPLGAIIAKDSITKWENGAHGSTFGGNPVCGCCGDGDARHRGEGAHAARPRAGRQAHWGDARSAEEASVNGGRARQGAHDRRRVREGSRDARACAGARTRAGGEGVRGGAAAAHMRQERAAPRAAARDRMSRTSTSRWRSSIAR